MSSFDSITANFNRMRNEQVSDKHIQAILYSIYFLGIFITLYLTTQQHKELRE